MHWPDEPLALIPSILPWELVAVADGWRECAVVMDELEAMAWMGTEQLRALVTPHRYCRWCGVELEARPGRGRPLV